MSILHLHCSWRNLYYIFISTVDRECNSWTVSFTLWYKLVDYWYYSEIFNLCMQYVVSHLQAGFILRLCLKQCYTVVGCLLNIFHGTNLNQVLGDAKSPLINMHKWSKLLQWIFVVVCCCCCCCFCAYKPVQWRC